MSNWQPESYVDLASAITRIEKALPGWWWSVGSCGYSSHASIGPDRQGPDTHLLKIKQFDEGFHSDLKQPSTCGQALNEVIDAALRMKIEQLLEEDA